MYATKGTANVIRSLGLECNDVARISSSEEIFKHMDEGKVDYVVYTGKTDVETDKTVNFNGKDYSATLVNVGNPHCVIFTNEVEDIDIDALGQQLTEAGTLPKGTFFECVRVVNRMTVKMCVWERGIGETWFCGTAATAAAVASVANGYCAYGEVITVKLKGGDLFVKYDFGGDAELDGTVRQSFEGLIEI